MWELIEFINGHAMLLDNFADFASCEAAANYQTYLNDGMALVICVVTL